MEHPPALPGGSQCPEKKGQTWGVDGLTRAPRSKQGNGTLSQAWLWQSVAAVRTFEL